MDWRDHAACLGMEYEVFFGPKDRSTRLWQKEAKAICATCPVIEACLEAAMTEERGHDLTRGRFGVRGGLTGRERIMLARERKGLRVPIQSPPFFKASPRSGVPGDGAALVAARP